MDGRHSAEQITGVLLAGGSALRMGGCDKSLLPLDQKPILDHVIARAQPQVDELVLNTNSDPDLFSRYDLPIVPDQTPAGPLAGILAAMEWIRGGQSSDSGTHWLASFPTDSPFFPENLVKRLHKTIQDTGALIACASSNGRRSSLFALWSLELMNDIAAQLDRKERKVSDFLDRHHYAVVPFEFGLRDPFFNINTVEDLKTARTLAAKT